RNGQLKLFSVTSDFRHHAIETRAVIRLNPLEDVLGRAFALLIESRYPLLVLLSLGNERSQRIEGIRFRLAHFIHTPMKHGSAAHFQITAGVRSRLQPACTPHAPSASYPRMACFVPSCETVLDRHPIRDPDRTPSRRRQIPL